MQENFENDYTIEEIKGDEAQQDKAGEEIKTQGEQVFSIQMAIEPHLFRSINDQIFGKTKKEKLQWKECHMEVRDQCIKLQVDEAEVIKESDQGVSQPSQDLTNQLQFKEQQEQIPGMMSDQDILNQMNNMDLGDGMGMNQDYDNYDQYQDPNYGQF